MKIFFLSLFIILSLRYHLSTQDNYQFKRYVDLNPDIDLLVENNNDNDYRQLLFYPRPYIRERQMLLFDTVTKTVIPLPQEKIGIDMTDLRWEYIWDPHIKKNNIYFNNFSKFSDERDGWYLSSLLDGKIVFVIQNNIQYWAHQSPPYIQFTNKRLFVSQYHYANDGKTYTSFFSVTDMDLRKRVWEYVEITDRFIDMFWVTDTWFIKKDTPVFISGGWKRHDTIQNYKTGETVSFWPEYIIGYGDGVILTTTEEKAGFIGITVWTPEKQILYRDCDFSISGIIERDYERVNHERPGIYKSYFDYPYIYCEVMRVQSISSSYATLIMNLKDGSTFYTPATYHLFGIFSGNEEVPEKRKEERQEG
jgi:hypothetical protein